MQGGKHLAAIADAQREGIPAIKVTGRMPHGHGR